MADTLDKIVLPAGTWVDVYASSGITVGTQLRCQNIGANDVNITVAATEPTVLDAINIFKPYEFFINSTGDSGAWVYSLNGSALAVAEA